MQNKESFLGMVSRLQAGKPNPNRYIMVGNGRIAWKKKTEIQTIVNIMVDLLRDYMQQEEKPQPAPVAATEVVNGGV